MGAALAPLGHRDFALLWCASLVSNVGSWMQTVAVGALITANTGRYAWTAVIAAAAFLPLGVLSPIGGALADRWPRRPALITGNLVQTVLAGVLAALVYAGRTDPLLLTVVVALQGCVAALVFPFQNAILPDLVPREELLAGASLASAQYNMGRVVGPLLAAIAIAVSGYGAAFAANAVSFLAVVVAMLFIRLPPPPGATGAGLWHEIRLGARIARAIDGCRNAIGLIALTALLASPFIALVPAMARTLTHSTKAAVGVTTSVLVVAQGVGAVLGALALAPLAIRFGRGRVLVFDLIALDLALIAYSASPTVAIAAIGMTIVGAIYIGVLSGLSTVVQLQAPAEYRGRVLSLFNVALGVVYPIGALIQGPLADRVGLRLTASVTALVMLGAVAALRVGRPSVFTSLASDATVAAATP